MQLGERSLSRSKYLLEEVAPAEAMRLFAVMDFQRDTCEDADLIGFAHYLRGCRGCVSRRSGSSSFLLASEQALNTAARWVW